MKLPVRSRRHMCIEIHYVVRVIKVSSGVGERGVVQSRIMIHEVILGWTSHHMLMIGVHDSRFSDCLSITQLY